MERELRREAEALYGLPPADFTKARNARAKELRREQADLAEQVAKLPKPTVAAAAINRLAREEPSEVRALVQAGRALRAAQEAAVAGKSAAAIAEATREHRAALDRVRREARKLDLSTATLDRVTATLRATSVDPELQQLLEHGVLAREAEAAGFGLDPSLVAAAPSQAPRRTGDDGESRRRRRDEARGALKEARERLTEAKREAAAAERERNRLAKELEAAERAAAAAAADVEQAAQAVEQARSAAEDAGRGG